MRLTQDEASRLNATNGFYMLSKKAESFEIQNPNKMNVL